MNTTRRPLADRFWEKVRKTEGCWIWTGSTMYGGYGTIRAGGRGGRLLYAHRVSWEVAHGPIPKNSVICHSCDNPPCVRPEHLFLGNQQSNLQDAAAKGRTMRGESHVFHKLTETQVLGIREGHAAGMSNAELAREHGVTPSNISAIIRHVSWRHVV